MVQSNSVYLHLFNNPLYYFILATLLVVLFQTTFFSVTSTSIVLLDSGLYLHSFFSDVPLHKKHKSSNQEEIKFRNNICDYTFKKLY